MIDNKKIRLKRIKREITNSNLLNRDFSIIYEKDYIKIICEDKYTFILNYDYPFKPPSFFINDYEYKKFLLPKNIHIRNIIYNYFGCPHCCSLFYNWSPTHFLEDLINEYKKNKKLYYQSYLIYFIQNMNKKYINDKYLIMNILNYII